MEKCLTLLFVLLVGATLYAQEHYLVEFESFSPPEKELISTLKGLSAVPFLAKDADGKEHFLNDYRGKYVILFFYSFVDQPSFEWLSKLNLLQIQYIDDLQIFGFAEEERSVIESALKDAAIVYPNFPNGTKFGEMAYAGDLGLGRMILIDEDGIIQEVLPRSWFERRGMDQAVGHLDQILTQMMSGR